jgi:hypothetical protein
MAGSYTAMTTTDLLWLSQTDLLVLSAEHSDATETIDDQVKARTALFAEALESETVVLPASDGRQGEEACKSRVIVGDRHGFRAVGQQDFAEALASSGETFLSGAVVSEKRLIRTTRKAARTDRKTDHKQEHNGTSALVTGEETAEDLSARWILDPGDPRKIKWDMFMGCLIVISVIIVPYRIGFDVPDEPWLVVDWMTDILFALDITMNFRTAYENDLIILVTVPSMIRGKYLKTWFLVDFFATVPIDKIMKAVASGGDGLRSLKLIRVLRLIRLLKLVRLLKLNKSAPGSDDFFEELFNWKVRRMFKMVLGLFFVAHMFGCLFGFVSLSAAEIDDGNTWWGSAGIDSEDLASS